MAHYGNVLPRRKATYAITTVDYVLKLFLEHMLTTPQKHVILQLQNRKWSWKRSLINDFRGVSRVAKWIRL